MSFTRLCPECGGPIHYKSMYNMRYAIRDDKLCLSCTRKGNKNSFYGRKHTFKSRKKMKKNNAHYWSGKRRPKHSKKMSDRYKMLQSKGDNMFGLEPGECHPNARRANRLKAIKRIENAYGIFSPNYSPEACKLIDEYGQQHGYNFQHAENGGEFHIKELGYWVDGYDEKKNVVVEVYEPDHYTPKGRARDKLRKKEIQGLLKCKFIVLDQRKQTHKRRIV